MTLGSTTRFTYRFGPTLETDPGYSGSVTVPRCEHCHRVHDRTLTWSGGAGCLGWLVGLVAIALILHGGFWQVVVPAAIGGLLTMPVFYLLAKIILGRLQGRTEPESYAKEHPAVRAKRYSGWRAD
ncbi:MAG: hypothetical protein JXA57_16075 [Armatimonadetes bacterium]|nr:hypothetical protein [Armatimonadota bacterium]